jgi:hypothetical protein
MKRLSLLLFCGLLLSFNLSAQRQLDFSTRKRMMEEGQVLFDSYMRIIRSGLIRDDTATIREFRSLFAPDAMIYDDLALDTAAMYFDEVSFRFKRQGLRERPLEEYIRHNLLVFPGGTSSSIENLNFSFFKLNSGFIKVVYEKKSDGMANRSAPRPFSVSNFDTLEMTMQFDPQFANPRILEIKRMGTKLSRAVAKSTPKLEYYICENNLDCDELPDYLDECPKVPGYDPTGCPSMRLTNGFTISFGMGLPNTQVRNFTANTAYERRDGINTFDEPKMRSSLVGLGFRLGVEYDIWFGKYKNWGLGFGASFSTNVNNFILEDTVSVGYRAPSDISQRQDYTQITTTPFVEERSVLTSIVLPIYFKYSPAAWSRKKFNVFVHAGVLIPLTVVSTTRSQYRSEYDARYSFSITGPAGQRFVSGNEARTSDWVIDANQVAKGGNSSNQNFYYDRKQQAGFNVGPMSQDRENTNTKARSPGIGFSLRGGAIRKLGQRGRNILICAEINFIQYGGPGTGDSQYFLTKSATQDDIQSISAAMRNMQSITFGGTIAYQWKLYRKTSKSAS